MSPAGHAGDCWLKLPSGPTFEDAQVTPTDRTGGGFKSTRYSNGRHEVILVTTRAFGSGGFAVVFTHRKNGPAGGATAPARGVGRLSSKAAVRTSSPVNFFMTPPRVEKTRPKKRIRSTQVGITFLTLRARRKNELSRNFQLGA